MQDPSKSKQTYTLLAVVFGVGGFIWIVYGLFTPHFILFPFIGLLNWAVAWYCWQSSKAG